MSTVWQQIEVRGNFEIPGLAGVRVAVLPVLKTGAAVCTIFFARMKSNLS